MPTEVIQIPAGTYNLAGGGSRTVTTLTVTEPGGTLNIPNAYTPTTNATAGASWSIRRNGVQVASGIVGTDAITHPTTGYTAGDTMTCRVISGAQTVTSAGKTLATAVVVSRTWLDTQAATGGSGTATHTYPLISNTGAVSGQKLLVVVNGNTVSSSALIRLTINGGSNLTANVDTGTGNTSKQAWFLIDRPLTTDLTFTAVTSVNTWSALSSNIGVWALTDAGNITSSAIQLATLATTDTTFTNTVTSTDGSAVFGSFYPTASSNVTNTGDQTNMDQDASLNTVRLWASRANLTANASYSSAMTSRRSVAGSALFGTVIVSIP